MGRDGNILAWRVLADLVCPYRQADGDAVVSLRAAGETFLPIHEEEDDRQWRRRLETATLLNMTEITLRRLVGKVFAERLVAGVHPIKVLREYGALPI